MMEIWEQQSKDTLASEIFGNEEEYDDDWDKNNMAGQSSHPAYSGAFDECWEK
jgi:hypothetical protein